MRWLLWIVFFCFPYLASAAEGVTTSRETKQGFFGVGGFYGMGSTRLLNADGSFTNYEVKTYGFDLTILLLDPSFGDIRGFARYQVAENSGSEKNGYNIGAKDTVFGLQFFEGQHVYLSAGIGNGQTVLSASNGTSVHMSYDVIRIGMGVQFAITESFFLSIEADYRNAPVRKAQNPELTDNTYLESLGAALKLTWSPPSEVINMNSGKK